MNGIGLPSGIRAWLRRGVAALGAVAVLTAFLLTVLDPAMPGVLRAPIAAVADAFGQSTVAWGLALGGIGYAVWRAFRGRSREPVAPDLAADATGDLDVDDDARTGHRFESIVADHAAQVRDPVDGGERIRSALADVVVDVGTRGGDRTEEELRNAIETGRWTDDRVVAAFLGGEPAPGFPLRSRIYGWLRPSAAFERRVERTVDEIYDRAVRRQGQFGDGSPLAGSRWNVDGMPADADRSTPGNRTGIDDGGTADPPGDGSEKAGSVAETAPTDPDEKPEVAR